MPKAKRQSTSSHLDRRQIDLAIRDAKDELAGICRNLLAGKVTFNYDNNICTGVPLDFHRCLAEWAQRSSISLAIRNIVLSSFYSTDVNQGGSGLISCLFWTGLAIPHDLERPRQSVSKIDEVDRVINSWSRGGMSCAIAKKLIRLGACGTLVDLKEGKQYATIINSVRGKKITGSVDPLFVSRVSTAGDEAKYYGVAIDGIVESTSQIHRILEDAQNQNVILLARGFLPDVSNTLAENWLNQKLRVIPFSVTDWGVESFLCLEAAGFECVSNESGGMVRNAKLQNLIKMQVMENQAIYHDDSGGSSKLEVSFGKDLASLKGVSIDRTKTLVGLSRFSSRSGVTEIVTPAGSIHVPISSFDVGLRAERSLVGILQNLGCVITSNNKAKENTKPSKEKSRHVKKQRIRRRNLSIRHR